MTYVLNFHSKVQEGRLLHRVVRNLPITEAGRWDLSPVEEFLQVAYLVIDPGTTYRPHLHVERPRMVPRTQEAWIVAHGEVWASLLDLDGSVLAVEQLNSGDLSISFAGGHTYEVKEGEAVASVFEVKLGPYLGAEVDKAYFD